MTLCVCVFWTFDFDAAETLIAPDEEDPVDVAVLPPRFRARAGFFCCKQNQIFYLIISNLITNNFFTFVSHRFQPFLLLFFLNKLPFGWLNLNLHTGRQMERQQIISTRK